MKLPAKGIIKRIESNAPIARNAYTIIVLSRPASHVNYASPDHR